MRRRRQSIFAHTLARLFADTEGVQFDETGKYIRATWLDDESRRGFEQMAKCVRDEFKPFCKKSGLSDADCDTATALTQGENIAGEKYDS